MARKQPKKPKKQRRRMRLLPVTVTMLSLLFVIKVNELYIDSERLRDMYAVRDASAEEKTAAAEKPASPAAPADPAAAKAAADAAADAVPSDGSKPGDAIAPPADPNAKPEDKKAADGKDAKPAEGDKPKDGEAAKEGDKPKEGDAAKDAGHGDEAKKEGGDKKEKKQEEPRTFGTGKSTLKEIEALKAQDSETHYTKTEVDLLENLSRRRDELDAREKDLDMKSHVLDATEKRINDKIGEMKTLQTEMAKVLAQYNEKQDAQIKSLVKIYEGMKPDEAAAIFNELEMPILLDVVSRMSERKVALVLANMNPKRARDVTQELADRRKKIDPSAANAGIAPAGK